MADVQGESVAADLGAENALFIKTDVSSWEEQSEMFKAADEWAGPGQLVFLAANAGVIDPSGSLDELLGRSEESISKPNIDPVSVNLLGTIFSVQLFAHYVRKHGKRGKAVLTSSSAGIYTLPTKPVYTASKYGIIGYMRSVAPNLQQEGIAVNAILPGLVPSGLTAPFLDMVSKQYITSQEAMVAGYEVFLDDETQMTGKAMEVSLENRYFRDHHEFSDEPLRWFIEDSFLGKVKSYP